MVHSARLIAQNPEHLSKLGRVFDTIEERTQHLTAFLEGYVEASGRTPDDGLTADQRLFMGWAQVWARKYRDENLLARLKSDPHSPSEYRCNGIVRNIPEFHTAFDVKESDTVLGLAHLGVSPEWLRALEETENALVGYARARVEGRHLADASTASTRG